MSQLRKPVLIRTYGDVEGRMNLLKVGTLIVIEARFRGYKVHQSMTSFSKQDAGNGDSMQTCLSVVVNWEERESSVQGIVVEAEITNVLPRSHGSAREILVFAKYRAEYEGNELPLHHVDNHEYCRDHVGEICCPGARIVLKVGALGWYANQCISVLIGTLDSGEKLGLKFVVANAIGSDESWVGKNIQAVVTSSYPTDLGHVVKCTFVKFAQEQSCQRRQPDRDIQSVQRSADSLALFRSAESDKYLAALRRDEEQRLISGEAATYNISVECLLQLKDQGITDPEDLQMYSRHRHFIEEEYTLQTLRRDYPAVYAMWDFATRMETLESAHFQDAASRLEGRSLPAWMPAYYMKDGRFFCTYHNGRGQRGNGGNCTNPGCTFTHKCLLCGSDKHGAFHTRAEGYSWVWKCPTYRRYAEQLAKLQGDGERPWKLPNGQPVQETHIRELFNTAPYVLSGPLNELRYAKLRAKYDKAQRDIALVKRLKARKAGGLVLKPAELKKLEAAEANSSAAMAQIEADDYYHLLHWRLLELEDQQLAAPLPSAPVSIVGHAKNSPAGAGQSAPPTAPGPPVPITISELMKMLTASTPASASLPVEPPAKQPAEPAATPPAALVPAQMSGSPAFVPSVQPIAPGSAHRVQTPPFMSAPSDGDSSASDADLIALSTFFGLEEATGNVRFALKSADSPPADPTADTRSEGGSERAPRRQRKQKPTCTYRCGAFEELVLRMDRDDRYDMGREVYRATLRNTLTEASRPVAVKMFDLDSDDLPDNFMEVIKEELKAMEKLNSLHTVKYIGSMEVEYPPGGSGTDYVAIIMEQEQCLLEEYLLGNCYNLPDAQYLLKIRPLIKQLLIAYTDIYDADIIHRDVKPENILVSVGHTGEAMVKVCDFGLCKTKDIRTRTAGHRSSVAGSNFVGTVYRGCWVAPEVLDCRGSSDRSYGRAADVWPLGLVFYFIGTRGLCPITRELETQYASATHPGNPKVAVESWNARLRMLKRTKQELMVAHKLKEVSTLSPQESAWSLHTAFPLLFDLIELMVRPYEGTGTTEDRIPVKMAAAHPFFWDSTIAARIVSEFVDEINSRYVALKSFTDDFNATCASTVLPDGWKKDHAMFRNLRGDYNENAASWLLKAVRDMLAHGRDSIAESCGYLSTHHYKTCLMDAFMGLYGPVLCALFRVSLSTTTLPNGEVVRRYGEWSGGFKEDFKFKFRDVLL